jgi:phage portal protein BeeE
MRPPWQWFRRQRGAKGILGRGDVLERMLALGQAGNAATPAAALHLYENTTAVSVPINFIADAFLHIEPVIRTGDQFETDHEILEFLRRPAPDFTRTLFFETLAKDHLITGETYMVGGGALNSPPQWVEPVSPQHLLPHPSRYGFAETWEIQGDVQPGRFRREVEAKNRLRYVDGNLRELKQIRSYSTKDSSRIRGQSLLEPAAAEARLHIEGGKHNEALLKNAGRGSLSFHFKQDLDPDTYKAVVADIRKRCGGSMQAGQIFVTTGEDLEIRELGTSNRDMDYATLLRIVFEAVANQYKVPLPLITVSAATLDNYTMALRSLYDYAVIPLVKRIFGGLGDFLLPRFGLDPARDSLSYDPDQIPALVSRRNEELLTRSKLAIESPDELREQVGRDPLPNGVGALPLVSATMVPIGSDLLAPAGDEL